jgi:type I restriction enzyme M protein
MDSTQLNWIANFIWGIADDVLRDIYVRGKYRDVILPMTVIRRLDALLEPTKASVLKRKEMLDQAGITNQEGALKEAAGQAFYNISAFTLRDLKARAKQQQLKADFEAYLDGFSPNVQEILDKFKLRNQIPTLAENDILGSLIEKFLDESVNLSPNPVLDAAGREKLPALDNHAMGTIFEELIRRFNEENNEEAGEHFTPRDVVKLMASLIFLPIADQIESATYLVYDGACGTGGMLTVAEETLLALAKEHGKEVTIHLYGQESQPETYAISKADLLLKGEGEEAENFRHGSTLSQDAFPSTEFDFMLSNPPYGKSWKTDLERMGGKADLTDPRFLINHAGDPQYNLVTRSSDGQLMFLVNKLSKMKHGTPLGSRIAEVHNGSSLFTGDAGQGESNVRRWLIEKDWLEAIIALPLNMFYNTGIATYIWVLANRKPEARQGKVQLIDATTWFKPLRKNLGKKNCELSPDDIQRIVRVFLDFKEAPQSKILPNEAFGYWKITVERPLRLHSQFTKKAVESLRYTSGDEDLRRELYGRFGQKLYDAFPSIRAELEQLLSKPAENTGDEGEEEAKSDKPAVPEKRRKKLLDDATWKHDHVLVETARRLAELVGEELHQDHNLFRERFDAAAKKLGIKLSASDRKAILRAVSWRVESAPPVIEATHKPDKVEPDPLHGRYPVKIGGKDLVVEYEPDTELRDTEQIPLLEPGGIEAFFRREVLPHVPDAWIDPDSVNIGYEISFTRHFYQPPQLRTLAEISADILKLERETESLLTEITKGVKA